MAAIVAAIGGAWIVFEAAAKKHPDIPWAKVDTQVEQDLAGALEVRSRRSWSSTMGFCSSRSQVFFPPRPSTSSPPRCAPWK